MKDIRYIRCREFGCPFNKDLNKFTYDEIMIMAREHARMKGHFHFKMIINTGEYKTVTPIKIWFRRKRK